MFTCRQIYDLITEYDEGFLEPEERRQFEAHVVICPPCRGFVSQMRAIREQPVDESAINFPAELEGSIVRAFRTWKNEQR